MPGTVESALQAVVQAYQGLTVAAGYQNDVRYVTRHIREPRDFADDQLVAVMVFRHPGQRGRIQWQDGLVYREDLRIEVYGFLRGESRNDDGDPQIDGVGLATAAETLLSDLKKLAAVDPTFGSPDIDGSKVVDDFNDAGFEDEGALVGIGLELILYYDNTRP